MAPFVAAEFFPGPKCESDEEIDEHIRKTSITVHHPAGTCRMGVDDGLGRRSGAAGARRRRSAHRRRLGDAGPALRQHQCGRHHDRREGRRPHPRRAPSRPPDALPPDSAADSTNFWLVELVICLTLASPRVRLPIASNRIIKYFQSIACGNTRTAVHARISDSCPLRIFSNSPNFAIVGHNQCGYG